jgi:rod shape determining protein RodA
MHSFVGTSDYFFEKQMMWIAVSFAAFLALTMLDVRFLRRTYVIMLLYGGIVFVLLLLLIIGQATQGAVSWFSFSGFSIQPSDPAKIVAILLLAKYFSRRHIEIANIRHIIVSGLYIFILFALVFLQPDFGSAIIIASIWLGMIMVSGISKKHLILVVALAVTAFAGMWGFVFEDYQKQRIMTFLNPLTDIQGSGYNAYQSTIAVGSGEVFGKGVGFGTQSRLSFLPEYETDFVFAAFAEEWGFIGVAILFAIFLFVVWRILVNAMRGATNFETLFGAGLAILFMSHFVVHVGMNIGLLPVTGTTIPFISYGGSHLLTEFVGLGLLMSMRRYSRPVHREDVTRELAEMST